MDYGLTPLGYCFGATGLNRHDHVNFCIHRDLRCEEGDKPFP